MEPAEFYVLEEGIQMPPHQRGKKRRADDAPPEPPVQAYPFNDMQVGQSFLVPYSRGNALRARAAQIAQSRGWSLACRAMAHGVRCWRLEDPPIRMSVDGPPA